MNITLIIQICNVMKKLTQNELLDQKIALLTSKHKHELAELKEQFNLVKEGFTPSNIIQEGIQGVYQTVANRDHLLSTVLSIVGGYISKKVVVGGSKNPIKNVLGYVLQFVVTNFLSKVGTNETVSKTE